MKLIPAMFFVIALFWGGLVFLQTRRPISGATGLRGMRELLPKKLKRSLTIILLFIALLFFLRLIGKIAFLIAGILFLISLLTFKKN